MKTAVYPGTFDPITYGHIDVIKKALKIFDKIVVGVSEVSNKSYLFSSEERIDIINKNIRRDDNNPNISNLLKNFCILV